MSNGRQSFSSDGSDGSREKSVGDSATPSDPLLDAVVQQTLSGSSELNAEDLAALQEVAARHPGAPLDLNPVGIELVERLLQKRLPVVRAATPLSREMAETIARTLLDHPVIRPRLEDLWRQLGESVAK